ncbi:hypothetical protein NDI39_02970 [Microcoleus sp. ZQ-A2]|jgi:hypothetical protein|nr:hypothetical protein [Microcoleus sp. FACHB-1]
MTFCQKISDNRRIESAQKNVFSGMKTLLFHAILATLGCCSLISGIQKAAYGANLSVLSPSESGLSRLSSDSLLGLENRNSSEDYSTIFSETKPLTEWQPIFLNQNTEVPLIQVPTVVLDLINSVEVNTGASSLDSDELVKVRYRMDLS